VGSGGGEVEPWRAQWGLPAGRQFRAGGMEEPKALPESPMYQRNSIRKNRKKQGGLPLLIRKKKSVMGGNGEENSLSAVIMPRAKNGVKKKKSEHVSRWVKRTNVGGWSGS